MTEFEKAVRHALIDRNMTMSSLANELGVSVSYVYDIVTGCRKGEGQKVKIRQILSIPDDVDEEQIVSQ